MLAMKHQNLIVAAFIRWLPIAVAFAGLCVVVYATVQQNYRQTANDPQIQLAEDTAVALGQGVDPTAVVGTYKIDMAKSQSSFAIIYDANGKVLATNGALNGQTPALPSGVLNYTKVHSQDRITWQPQPSSRFALVIQSFSGKNSGFIGVGRSLRDTEIREGRLWDMVLIALFGGLAAIYVVAFFAEWLAENGKKRTGPVVADGHSTTPAM